MLLSGVDLVILDDAPLNLQAPPPLRDKCFAKSLRSHGVRRVATTKKIWLDERPGFEWSHAEFLEAVRGRESAVRARHGVGSLQPPAPVDENSPPTWRALNHPFRRASRTANHVPGAACGDFSKVAKAQVAV